jgi:hypothetical protein
MYKFDPEYKKYFLRMNLSVSTLKFKVYNNFGLDITCLLLQTPSLLYDF